MRRTHQAMELVVHSQNGRMPAIGQFHQIVAEVSMCLLQVLFAGSDI